MLALVLIARLAWLAPAACAQAPSSSMFEMIDDRLAVVAPGSDEEARILALVGELRKAGTLADWADARREPRSPEDERLLREVSPLLPALSPERAFFVYEPDVLYRVLGFDGRNLGITMDKDTGRGVMFVKGDQPLEAKRHTTMHEGVHLEHRPVFEEAQAVERAFRDVGGTATIDGGYWASWLEEGYTESLAVQRLRSIPSSGALAPIDVYKGRVRFVEALIAAGGEDVVRDVCRRADAAALARFLGARRMLLLTRILNDLAQVEGFGGLDNDADFQRALRVISDPSQTGAVADEFVRSNVRWEIEQALMGTGRRYDEAAASVSARIPGWSASYLDDPQAVSREIRQALRPGS